MNPNTFKKGDTFKIFGGGTFTVGYITGPYIYYRNNGAPASVHYSNCLLVGNKFGVGDYVRSINTPEAGNAIVLDKECGKNDEYSVKFDTWYGECRDMGNDLILVSRAGAIDDFLKDGKYIEAIKEYRTIHGVGLKEAKDAIDAIRNEPKVTWSDDDGGPYNEPSMSMFKNRADYDADSGQTLGDILGKALASRNKFKTGDKVYTEDGEDDVGTVLGFRDGAYAVQFPSQGSYDASDYFDWKEHELTLYSPVAPTIVVRHDVGKGYRPNDKPRVHNTVAEATAEAERLAKANPGVKFDTFTLATSSVATKPVESIVTTVKA